MEIGVPPEAEVPIAYTYPPFNFDAQIFFN